MQIAPSGKKKTQDAWKCCNNMGMAFRKGGTFKIEPACVFSPISFNFLLLFSQSCLLPSPTNPISISLWHHMAALGLLLPMGRLPIACSLQPDGARLPLPVVGINWHCSQPGVPVGFKRSSRSQIQPDIPGARCSSARHIIRDKTCAWLQISSRASISTEISTI